MSGRIFDVDDSNIPRQRPPERPKRKPRNWKPFLYIVIGVISIGILAVGAFSIWSLRKRIQSVVTNLPTVRPSASPTPTTRTKFESFKLRYGTVTVRGSSIVGSPIKGIGGTLTTQAVQLSDVSTKETAEGLVFTLKQNVGYLRNEGVSVIDYDEVDSLLQGLDYVAKVNAGVTPLDHFEAVYHSRGGFQIGVYNDDKGKISAGFMSGDISPVTIGVKLEDLSPFRSQIVAAKGKLDAVRVAPGK